MNLRLLTDPRPETKPWLNISANTINCQKLFAGEIGSGGGETILEVKELIVNDKTELKANVTINGQLFPPADGDPGQIISTNGAGVLGYEDLKLDSLNDVAVMTPVVPGETLVFDGLQFVNTSLYDQQLSTTNSPTFENLTINDTLTTQTLVRVDEIEVKDNIIIVGKDNPGDTLTQGLVMEHDDVGPKYSGLMRDGTTHEMYLLENVDLPTPAEDLTTLEKGILNLELLKVNNYTLPTADGTAGQFIVTDGMGDLGFESVTISDIDGLSVTAPLIGQTLVYDGIGEFKNQDLYDQSLNQANDVVFNSLRTDVIDAQTPGNVIKIGENSARVDIGDTGILTRSIGNILAEGDIISNGTAIALTSTGDGFITAFRGDKVNYGAGLILNDQAVAESMTLEMRPGSSDAFITGALGGDVVKFGQDQKLTTYGEVRPVDAYGLPTTTGLADQVVTADGTTGVQTWQYPSAPGRGTFYFQDLTGSTTVNIITPGVFEDSNTAFSSYGVKNMDQSLGPGSIVNLVPGGPTLYQVSYSASIGINTTGSPDVCQVAMIVAGGTIPSSKATVVVDDFNQTLPATVSGTFIIDLTPGLDIKFQAANTSSTRDILLFNLCITCVAIGPG